MSILGVAMFFIGKVLIINALWLGGKVETKDAGVFNVMVGTLAVLVALSYGLWSGSHDGHVVPLMAGLMLFAFTYVWVGINALRGAEDQRGLGYFCLLVAIATIPFGYHAFLDGDMGWVFNWATYGILWFLFFMVLGVGSTKAMPATIFMTWFVGITVWVTGWTYLYGYWPFGPNG